MRLLVLYGSQTGTAQDIAEQIWRESKHYNCSGPLLAMDDYPTTDLVEERYVVFVVATTGNGDEPDNMKKTWRILLRRKLPTDLLSNLRFACLGLGDSSYANFNYAAKKLTKRLKQLGAKTLIPLGTCDDQHDYGLSAISLPWIQELWSELKVKNVIFRSCLDDSKYQPIYKWRVKVVADRHSKENLLKALNENLNTFHLKDNKRTTTLDHFQDVRLIRFDIPENINWTPGDVLTCRPCNTDEQVAEFFQLIKEHQLDFNANTVVSLKPTYEDMPLPSVYKNCISIGDIAKYIWDFNMLPRQRAFELLAQNCEDIVEKEKCIEFTTPEGLDNLINYVNRPKRTILEVLQDFRHATSKLTLPILFELFPIIQQRSYSIASAKEAGTLDLLVAVVNYKTKLSKPRLGLCTNWLKSLEVGTEIQAALKSSTMNLPKDLKIPLIMVGPGTGIAPFRSIIQSRLYEQKLLNQEIGQLLLFFGCRNKLKDYHFSNDLTNWQDAKSVKIFTAFSRDQPYKVYVQHLIEENAAELKDLIYNQKAVILVAGASKNMPKSVKEAFINILDHDTEYLEDMIKTKRYQEETWS